MRTAGKRLALLLAAALLCTGCSRSDMETVPEGAPAAELEVRFFNAGKADAILLSTKSTAVLIDTGEKGFGKTILEYLEEKDIRHIDCLILTHFDKDHVGGAAKVINSIPVDRLLQSNQPKDSEEYENYVKACEGAGIEPVTVREICTFILDGVRYEVDPPRQLEYGEDSSNNSSLMVTVQNGEDRFLFAGDAQTLRLEEYLDSDPAGCDVLKLPHHGREEPLLEDLLAAVQPAFAVITSSEEEPESQAVLDTLAARGVRVLLTREGAVTMYSSGGEITVEQDK